MAITRTTTSTVEIASVTLDDYGNVDLTVLNGSQLLTPLEALLVASELMRAATTAQQYRDEQQNQAGAA